MKDLLLHIDTVLAEKDSLVIDEAEFRRITSETDYRWTRNSVNRIAFLIPMIRRKFVASAESMLNLDTREVARVYLIVARSPEAYRERVLALREQVERELGTIIGKHENRFMN